MKVGEGCVGSIGALFAMIAISGCGGASQTDVAQVAKVPITYSEFAHHAAVAVRQGGGLIPDPPSYTKCVAQIVATTPAIKHEDVPAVARVLRARRVAQCARLQREYNEAAMQALISGKWASLAAKRAGITLSSTEVQKAAREQLQETLASKSGGAEGSPQALEAELKRIQEQREQEQHTGLKTEEKRLQSTAQELTVALSKARVREREVQKEYLKTTGLTIADLQAEATAKLLYDKLEHKALRGVLGAAKKVPSPAPVARAEIGAYYRRHLAELFRPKVRDIEMVMTNSAAKAREAKAALQAGQSIDQVNKRYATESTTNGGKSTVTAPTKLTGGGDTTLTRAEFDSPVGQVVGPIRSAGPTNTYFVLRVARVLATHDTPLADVSQTISSTIEGQRQKVISARRQALEARESKAAMAFEKQYVQTWTRMTICRKGYIVRRCRNASPAAKAAELPKSPKTHRTATPVDGKTRGPVQALVNNSPIPDTFGLLEAGVESPAEYLEGFAEKKQSFVMKLEPGEYTIEALNEPTMKVAIVVR